MNLARYLSVPAIVASTMALAAAPLAAATADADKMLAAATEQVLAIAYDPTPSETPLWMRVKPLLEKHFDLVGITRRAVGPGWRNLSAEQQAKASTVFGELVLRTYADRFKPGERPKINYGKPVELAPNRREIPQIIGYNGQNYSIAYRMELQPGGEWRVYDVIVEGVSMISNYRAQFESILQKSGPDGLLRSLEENLARLGTKS